MDFKNLASTFIGPIRIKAHKNFGEKGAWAYPGAAQIIWVPPIISGKGRATDFEFCRNIHRKLEQKQMKNFGNRSRGCSQGVPKFFQGTHV